MGMLPNNLLAEVQNSEFPSAIIQTKTNPAPITPINEGEQIIAPSDKNLTKSIINHFSRPTDQKALTQVRNATEVVLPINKE